jgi:DNA-binding CsgD family transcriptional regulator
MQPRLDTNLDRQATWHTGVSFLEVQARKSELEMQAKACVVMVNVPRNQWCYAVTEKRQTIGRATDAAIKIPQQYRSVSRDHAKIWADKKGIWLSDAGSSCGTRVNGIWLKAAEPSSIVLGDRLTFGSAEFRLLPALKKRDPQCNGELHTPHDGSKTAIFRTPEPLATRMTLQSLSHCEHNIVLWMARGYIQEDELGRILHRSPNTIRTQIASVLKKLQLHSRVTVLNQLMREGASIRIHEQSEESAH